MESKVQESLQKILDAVILVKLASMIITNAIFEDLHRLVHMVGNK